VRHFGSSSRQKRRNSGFQDKVISECFYLMFYGLMLLLIIRVLVLNHPYESVWDISLLFLGTSFYLVLRLVLRGEFHEKDYEKRSGFDLKKAAKRGIISTVGFILLMLITGFWELKSLGDVISTIVGGLVFFLFTIFFPYVSYKMSG